MNEQPGRYNRIRNATFAAGQGDIAMVRLQRGREELPLGAAAVGLISPSQGSVLFEQRDWATTLYETQVAMRSQIGRVFDHPGWINNLSIEENVLLSGQHHTTSTKHALRKSAVSWARRFGIKDIPKTRLAFVTPWKQRVFQWVRALMGDPKLLVLERPTNDVPDPQKAMLLEVVIQFCKAGGTALWLTDDDELWASKMPPSTRRYQIEEDVVVPVDTGGGGES